MTKHPLLSMHTSNSPIFATSGTFSASTPTVSPSIPASGSYQPPSRHLLFMRQPPHPAEAPYQGHQELQLQQSLWAEVGTRAGALAELVRVTDPSAEISVDAALAQAELHAGLIMQALVALQTQRAERKQQHQQRQQQVHTPRSHKPRSLSSPGPYVWSSYSASASKRESSANSPKLEEMELEAQSRSGVNPAQTWHSPRQRHGSLPTIEPKHYQMMRPTPGKSRQQPFLTPSSRTSPPGSSSSSGSPPFSPRHLMDASTEMGLSNPTSFGDSIASPPLQLLPPGTSSSGHAVCFMPVQIPMPESESEGFGRMKRAAACVQCGTTETPEWRSSEEGPRTLCNACGLRRARKKTKQRNEERKRTKEKGSIAAILNST